MENKNIINDYIEKNNIKIRDNGSGLSIKHNYDELYIKGSQKDLIDLADIILSLALSENKKDHVHVDELTIIDGDSDINEMVIEKE